MQRVVFLSKRNSSCSVALKPKVLAIHARAGGGTRYECTRLRIAFDGPGATVRYFRP